MRIPHNQQLGHTWLIIKPLDTMLIGLHLINNNAPFPAYNVVVGQSKPCSGVF